MSNNDIAVAVRGVRKSFGKVVALDDVEFRSRARRSDWSARPERRGQDDHGGHLVDADPTGPRHGNRRRLRRRLPVGRCAPLDHGHRAGSRCRRRAYRRAEPGAVRSSVRAEEVRGTQTGSRSCSSTSASRMPGSGRSAPTPAGCVDGWTSRAGWWSSPRWPSWTSRPPGWIPVAGKPFGIWWAASRRWASPRC